MNCQEINSILDSSASGEIHAEQKQAIERHLESCRACRDAWAAYRELSALQIPRTPPHLHSRIAAALLPAKARVVQRPLIVGGILVLGVAVAATVVLEVKDGGPRIPQRLEEPAPIKVPQSEAQREPFAASADRVEDAANADGPNEATDSNGGRTDHLLDPNSVVVVPVLDHNLDQQTAALFRQFFEELVQQLQTVPGLNVAGPELVDPFLTADIREEEIARGLGAAHLIVISTTPEPDVKLRITQVDAATGSHKGSMGFRPISARWPAQLPSDVAKVAQFIEDGLKKPTPAERSSAIADARAIVLNASLPPATRVEALGKLPQTPEARSDDIVVAAVELATIAPELHASIWRAMYGVDNPYLIEPLLNSLVYDAAEHRRRAAASTLSTFATEPRVKAALEQAQANDVSDTVREAALNALLTDEEHDQRALQILFDETLTDRERLQATSILAGRNIRDVPLTEDAAQAVFNIGASTTDPEIRSWAWGKLGRDGVDNPKFLAVLLDDLDSHPSDSVRSMAANALKQYADDSAVRTALERAESDSSFKVRLAAGRALGKIPR